MVLTIVLSYRKLLEFSYKAVAGDQFNVRKMVQSKCRMSVESFTEHMVFIYVYESEETQNGLPYYEERKHHSSFFVSPHIGIRSRTVSFDNAIGPGPLHKEI